MKIVRNLLNYLCIFVLFTTFSCQDDTLIEVQQKEILQKKSTFKSSTLYKKDIETNVKLNTKMNSLSTLQNQQIGKSVYNETYDFTIDTDVAKFVENTENDSHSYTFAIHRANSLESSIENIVFSYNIVNDTYEASMVTYLFSVSQRQEYLQNGYVSTPYDIHYESVTIDSTNILNKSSLPCTVTYQEFHQPQGSNNSYLYSSNGFVQNQCEHESDDDNPCNTYTVIDIYCPDGGSSGSENATDDNTPPSNTSNNSMNGGGGNSGMDNEERIVTSPIISPIETVVNCMDGDSFNPRLSDEILQWLQANRNYSIEISNYILNNGCDDKSKDFLDEAISILIANGEVDFEEKIILDSNFIGKAKCIYNRLENTNTKFKDLLKRFDGEFPVSHLTFKVDNSLPEGNYGLTHLPENYNIVIAFSNTQLGNISDLGAVICFAHEVIHAEIFRKMLEAAKLGNLEPATMTRQQQIDYVNSLKDNFPGIYDYYIARYKPTWNHNMMAQHYRTVMADILEEYDNSSKPREVYESLAWAGLRTLEDLNSSVAWDALTETEKQTVINHLNTYFHNGDATCN